VYLDFGAGHRGLDTIARPLGPTIVHRSSISVDRPSRSLELLQRMVEFDPGIWTPRNVHTGQELALVASGEITLERRGEVEVFKAGAAWVNPPGLIHAEGNAGGVFAQVAATFLLPEGAQLTTV
jgi:quercetin dioxygenase-like cupin family protein